MTDKADTKICNRCKIEKSTQDFYVRYKNRDGLSGVCKQCSASDNKRWCENNRERKKEKDKIRYENNRDKFIVYSKEYRLKNKGKCREYIKTYYCKNPDVFAEIRRRYKKSHREKFISYRKNRLALIRGSIGRITLNEWKSVCDKYGNRCLCCGSKDNITLDHIVPIKLGGENTIENAQPLCRRCNSSKGIKIIDYRTTNES